MLDRTGIEVGHQVSGSKDLRLDRIGQLTLEDVGIDDVIDLDVAGLILIGILPIGIRIRRILAQRVLVAAPAQLEHTPVIAEGQAGWLDIDPATRLVIIVEAILAEFDLDGAGFILDEDALVDVTGTVLGNHLAADDHIIIFQLDRLADRLVQGLELGNGRVRRHCHALIHINIVVFQIHDRIPFLTGGEKHRCSGKNKK